MQVATYKGRKYKLAWSGKTKFGEKAKLQFWDGSKEFWVDLSLVSISEDHSHSSGNARKGRRYGCPECGEYVTRGDGSRCWETGFSH
jgi:hypothetical protein